MRRGQLSGKVVDASITLSPDHQGTHDPDLKCE
jgi:hypothetical protein